MKNSDHSCDHHDDSPKIKTDFLQITATADSRKEAETLINLLTGKQLAACAQVQGTETAGKADSGLVWRCRFKTSSRLYPELESVLNTFFDGRKYTIKASPIVKGSSHFLGWLKGELRQT